MFCLIIKGRQAAIGKICSGHYYGFVFADMGGSHFVHQCIRYRSDTGRVLCLATVMFVRNSITVNKVVLINILFEYFSLSAKL